MEHFLKGMRMFFYSVRRGGALVPGMCIAITVCLLPVISAAASDTGSATNPPAVHQQKAAHPPRNWKNIPDFNALRREYGNRADFDNLCGLSSKIPNVIDLLKNKQWTELLRATDAALYRCPVDIDDHALQAIALSHLSRKAEAEIHEIWREGLIVSIMDSGDGFSPETAWVVISVSEEYALLHALDLESHEQALLNDNIDTIRVVGKGQMMTLYFNTSASLRRLDKALGRITHDPETR